MMYTYLAYLFIQVLEKSRYGRFLDILCRHPIDLKFH